MSHMDSIRPNSREAIERAGLELLSANPAASLSDVATRAGVGRATLHRHFPARADLVRALAIEALDATDAACEGLAQLPTAREALEQMFEALVPLGPHYAFLARCEVDDTQVRRRYAEQVESLRALVEALREEGRVSPRVPTAWAMALIDQLIWMAWSLVASGEVASREAASLSVRTVLEGLGGTP